MRCVTVLTDPDFLQKGQPAYLGYGLWSPRRRPPAMTIEDLPLLHGVVLSRMRGDHWDRVAENGFDHGLPIGTTRAAAKTLYRTAFHAAIGLDT